MEKTENFKTNLIDIEEIPINDFSKLKELIDKGRYGLGVNLSYIRHLKDIKEMFKFSDYILIKLFRNFVYLLMLLAVTGAIIFSNYYLLIGIPLFLILKDSGIIDIWISILISAILLILIFVFNIDDSTFWILLFGSALTYISSKFSYQTFIKKMKEKSLKTEKNFCLSFQMNFITITDVGNNEIYSIENNKKST